MKINFVDLTFRFEQAEGVVFPAPFFIHEDEIIIWAQNQSLYCQFRIVEGDNKECARLLVQYRLEWEYTILKESIPYVYDSESPFILPEEMYY